MAKWGILKLHPFTKAMNKLTVTIRISFLELWNQINTYNLGIA